MCGILQVIELRRRGIGSALVICSGGLRLRRHLPASSVCVAACLAVLLCVTAVGQQQGADYGDFIAPDATPSPAVRPHTWSTTPSGDGDITSSDKIDENELLAGQPLAVEEDRVSALASEVLGKNREDSGDMLARLLSSGGGPAPGTPMHAGRMKKLIAAGVVALLGAAVGIGVALLRARYGKGPNPLRNVRAIRGQSPTPPTSSGRRML